RFSRDWSSDVCSSDLFIDRVLSPGLAYDHHPRGFGLVPLLKKVKSITVITTMNKPKIMYALLIGNLIRKVMLKSVFKTMGYKNRSEERRVGKEGRKER